MAFPTTSVLDNFNRANEGPPPSASWTSGGIFSATPGLSVNTNVCAGPVNTGGCWGTSFGADQEVFFTLATLGGSGSQFYLAIRISSPGSGTTNGYYAPTVQDDTNPGFRFSPFRVDGGVQTLLGIAIEDTSGVATVGDMIGCSFVGSTWSFYRKPVAGAWTLIDTRSDATYSGGSIGTALRNTTWRIDDFSGGTVVAGVDTGLAWIRA